MTEVERKVYEASGIPLAIYSTQEGRVVTDLVSDGFCRMMGVQREPL